MFRGEIVEMFGKQNIEMFGREIIQLNKEKSIELNAEKVEKIFVSLGIVEVEKAQAYNLLQYLKQR